MIPEFAEFRYVKYLIPIFIILCGILWYMGQQKNPMAEKVIRSKTPVGVIGDSTQTKWEEDDDKENN